MSVRMADPVIAVATLLLGGSLLAGPRSLGAQPVTLGRIDEIVDLELPDAPEVTGATTKVQMQVGPAGTWIDVERDAALGPDQRLRVRRLLNVRVRVDYRRAASAGGGTVRHHGELVFLTDLLFDEVDGIPASRVFRASRVDEAVYQVTTSGTRGPTVSVEQGSLVARWEGGELVVLAAGRRILVSGTDVAFHAYAGGDSALVYLREGTITFLDTPGVVASSGQLFLVTPDGPPVELTGQMLPQQALGWDRATRFNGQVVWGRSVFGRLPWYGWVGGVAAVVGAGWCVSQECWVGDGGGGSRSGIVLLRLPFS